MFASAGHNSANVPVQTVDTNIAGGAGVGGVMTKEKDIKAGDAPNQAKFGDILEKMQAKYGAKKEKPREIKKTLGKDDFLRIMVEQMKHQDPTSPFKAEQMAAQMAQFATVEQLNNINQGITKLQNANQPAERMAMTNMIGKTVTVDRERFPHTEGQNEALSFVLPKDAKETKVYVLSENGESVFDKDLGNLKAGENTVEWDGLKKNSLPAKNGTYILRVEAKDERGVSMPLNTQKTDRVIGVSFENGEAVLLVGNNKQADKVPFRSVVRVDEDQALTAQQAGRAPASAPGAAASAPAGAPNNFFTFKKGEGSSNASPEAAAELMRMQESTQPSMHMNNSAPIRDGADDQKGFANGLQDGQDVPMDAAQEAMRNKPTKTQPKVAPVPRSNNTFSLPERR